MATIEQRDKFVIALDQGTTSSRAMTNLSRCSIVAMVFS